MQDLIDDQNRTNYSNLIPLILITIFGTSFIDLMIWLTLESWSCFEVSKLPVAQLKNLGVNLTAIKVC